MNDSAPSTEQPVAKASESHPGQQTRRRPYWESPSPFLQVVLKWSAMDRGLASFARRLLKALPGQLALTGLFTLAGTIAFCLRFEGEIPPEQWDWIPQALGLSIVIKLLVFRSFRVPGGWRAYLTFRELAALAEAVSLSSLLLVTADYLLLPDYFLPRSVCLVDWGSTLLLVGGARAASRLAHERYQPLFIGGQRTRALIVGANDSGEALLRAIQRGRDLPYQVIGFVANDPRLVDSRIGGVRVVGTLDQAAALARLYGVQALLIMAEELPGRRVRELTESCRRHQIDVRVLPSYSQLLQGAVSFQARNVSIEDLLRREPVELDVADIRDWLTGRVVMVTGGSGSIGSEICRQLLRFRPAKLVVIDRSESAQFFTERELRRLVDSSMIEICIADVADKLRMETLFRQYRPDVLFHAAAYKHVPLMEANPGEAIKNNILGTQRLAELADQFQLQSFVLISTDKAVNPTSVMGACKRVGERFVQSIAGQSSCRFVTVRFGNVLDSVGSVVPIFREQIARGGPVTVTDPDMQRYFMTIPEAAQLVIQAGAMGRGGEIFVLAMGEPVRIMDLAQDMIRLSGFRVGEDIEICITGRRPGEKLIEELQADGETYLATRHSKILIAQGETFPLADVIAMIDQLRQVAERPAEEVIAELQRVVAEYRCPDASSVLPFTPAAEEEARAKAA